MRVIMSVTLLCFLSISLRAQTFLIFLGGGLVNYGGDLQHSPVTLNHAHGYIQGGFGVKVNDHLAINYLLGTGKLSANDATAGPKYIHRNLSFYTNFGETFLNFEYDLLDISGINNFTPYGFAGIGAFRFKPYTFDADGNKVYLQPLGTEGQGIPELSDKQLYNLLQFEIPFGLGIKYAIAPHLILAGEMGFRKLFTDYVDDVSSLHYADTATLRSVRGPLASELSFRADEIPGSKYQITAQRGNPNNPDTFYTFQIKLIVSLDKSIFNY